MELICIFYNDKTNIETICQLLDTKKCFDLEFDTYYVVTKKKTRDFLKSILFILFFISFLDTKRKKEKMVEIEK